MPIPNPNDPTTSAAYVDPDGIVRVKDGISAPRTAVGVVGFVPGMCLLWKGLAANKPKGWVIESAPAGSYLKIASSDGEMGSTGGSATAADHVHTGDPHFHDHEHFMDHTHDMQDHQHGQSHTHSIEHNHPSFNSGVEPDTPDAVTTGVNLAASNGHTHPIDVPNYTGSSGDSDSANTDGSVPNTTSGSDPDTTFSDGTGITDGDDTGGVVGTPVALTPLFYGLYLIRFTGAP